MLPTPKDESLVDEPARADLDTDGSNSVELPAPFPSLSALRAAHNALLDAHREEGDTDQLWQTVTDFLQRGRATGALLDNEDEQWAAQSLLDYWSATGYSIGREMPDAVLDEFDSSLAPEIPDDQCPYVGLAAFREGQRPYFFGRKQLVETLITKVAAERLLAVVGPSGSGKSSVVLAGLLPALHSGAVGRETVDGETVDGGTVDGGTVDGETADEPTAEQQAWPRSDHWRYSQRMVPGSDPLVNLEQAILPRAGREPTTVALAAKFAFAADGFRREPDYLLKLINETGTTPFVLVIDQFEEIFTLCTDDELRQAFIDNLLALIQAPDQRHTVILTMRTDFESFVARLPNFQPHFEAGIVRVTPLNAAELRAVIEQPAALVGLRFEDGVVDALVQDVLGEPAALPLLQFTLLKLWESRERNRITWQSYKELGGGRLALARSADRLYESLIPEEQVTARRILLRLVRPGDGLEITSNRVRRAVLYQTGEARDRVDRVLNRLVAADLLRLSPGEKPEDTQVEVAHEALVRNWPRLVGWLEDERGRIRERLRLTEAAEQWFKLDHDPGALLRGTLLEDAQRHPDLSELEEAYVQASLAAREAAVAEREAVRQRELEQARALAAEQQRRANSEREWAEYQTLTAAKLRQRAWLLVLTAVSGLLLAALAIWLGFQATSQANNAINQHATATAAVAVANRSQRDAEAQATAADSARRTAEAERATAIAAVAEVRAEQTRVRHLQNAIDFASEQLDSTPAPPTPSPATPPVESTAIEPTIPVVATLVPITPNVTVTPQRTLTPPTPLGPTPTDGVTGSANEDSTAVATTEPTDDAAAEDLTPTVENTVESTVVTETPVPTTTAVIDETPAATITTTVPISANLIAIVPDIEIPLYAEPNEKAQVLQTLRAPQRPQVLEADSFWVKVVLDDDTTGWVQAWLLTYRGDARLLPLELRYLVVSEEIAMPEQTSNELPYTYGEVISVDGVDGYELLNAPNQPETGLIRVPVGTDVTLLRRAKENPDLYTEPWYFVRIVDPGGDNQIWQGFLPGAVITQR